MSERTAVYTIDPETAQLLGSEIRAVILDELAESARSITQLNELLDERGFELAETSVRHHVGVLEDAGMLDVARREDVNGGTRKFYRATVRAYAFDASDAETRLHAMQGLVRAELLSLCSRLGATHREDFTAAAGSLEPQDCYENGDQGAYVFRELVERALADLETSGTLDERLPPIS